VAIDVVRKELFVGGSDFYRVDPHAIQNAWPSWKVCLDNECDDTFVVRHFNIVGEALPSILARDSNVGEHLSLDDRIEKLRELVFTADATKTKTAKSFADMIDNMKKRSDEPIQIAPGADKIISSEAPEESFKSQLFNEVVEYIRHANQSATEHCVHLT
jgi:hypothetical protein